MGRGLDKGRLTGDEAAAGRRIGLAPGFDNPLRDDHFDARGKAADGKGRADRLDTNVVDGDNERLLRVLGDVEPGFALDQADVPHCGRHLDLDVAIGIQVGQGVVGQGHLAQFTMGCS